MRDVPLYKLAIFDENLEFFQIKMRMENDMMIHII
jgi:hypothetical protein